MDLFSYVIGAFITLVVLFFTVTYLYLTWHYGTLEKLGIPVLKPVWCLGSIPGVYRRIQQFDDVECLKKFGKVWGLYDGRTPTIFVANPDIVKQIFIKDFKYFKEHRNFNMKRDEMREALSLLSEEKWKILRSALTPAFTSKKLKGITKIMIEIVDEYMNGLQKDVSIDKVIDVSSMYGNLVMEVIAGCIFGTKISYKDKDNEFFRKAVKFSAEESIRSPIILLLSLFPFLLSNIKFFDDSAAGFFANVCNGIMKERREQKKEYGDFVDFLNELYCQLDNPDFKRLGITEKTLCDQAMLFLIAGHTSTTATLVAISYYLAKYPEVQNRVIAEVDQVVEKYGEISYDTMGHLEYLTACINETVRFCPGLIRLERSCNKEWTSEDGSLTIPRGVIVKAAVFAMHRDPDFFPDPEEFNPDRFLGSQHINPYTFMPFGLGPRNCIGMRFAMEQVKVTIAKILQNFHFSLCPESEFNFIPGILFPVEPLRVGDTKLKMEPRICKA